MDELQELLASMPGSTIEDQFEALLNGGRSQVAANLRNKRGGKINMGTSDDDRASAIVQTVVGLTDEKAKVVRAIFKDARGETDSTKVATRYRQTFSIVADEGFWKDFSTPNWSNSKDKGMVCEKYASLGDCQRIILMRCCIGLADCLVKLGDKQKVRDIIRKSNLHSALAFLGSRLA